MLRVAALFAAVAVASAAAQGAAPSCPNAVVAYAQSAYGVLPNAVFLSSPQNAPTTTVCPYLSGQPSCCTSSQFNQLQNGYNAWSNAIAQGVQQIKSYKLPAQPSLNNIFPGATAQQQQVFQSFINDLWTLLQNFIGTFASRAGQCAGGFQKYVAGAYCFLCDAQWQSYFTPSTQTLNIAQASCTSLVADCTPTYQSVLDLILAIKNRALQFASDFVATMGNLPDSAKTAVVATIDAAFSQAITDPCNGDCTSLICNKLVNGGLSANLPSVPNLGAISNNLPRDVVTSVVEAAQGGSVDVARVRALLDEVFPKTHVAERQASPSTSSINVQYGPNGLQVYSNGQSTALYTQNNAATTLSAAALLAVAAVVAAIAA